MSKYLHYARRAAAGAGICAVLATATTGCGSLTSSVGSGGGGGSTSGQGVGGAVDGAVGGGVGADAGSTGGAGDAGGDDAPSVSCALEHAPPQRLVRLTFSQLAHTITALLGLDAMDGVSVPGRLVRGFVPLATEGSEISSIVLEDTLSMVEDSLSRHLSPNRFAVLSGCADDDCVRQFLLAFADRAFRRPLVDEEKNSILQSYAEMRTAGLGPGEAGPSAIEAILVSPAALYRTEFGPPGVGAGETALTPYERASQLSYFLSDGPPDNRLRQAAENGDLATSSGLLAETDRYLQTTAVRDNLTGAMFAYYQLGSVRFTVKDLVQFPEWSSALIDGAYAEAQAFMAHTLWEGSVFDQLTSHRSFIDENLARLYGVTYPAAPGSGLLAVDLPESQRSGLLTLVAWLAPSSRPDITSILARNLRVIEQITCGRLVPLHPDNLTFVQPGDSELEKARFRLSSAPCSSCHQYLDAYGVLLESYDPIGRFRTQYNTGEPIVTQVDLPAEVGGGTVQDVAGFARQVTASGAFSTCLTASLIQYANASLEPRPSVDTCAVRNAHARFWSSDRTFPSLIREVAVSQALSRRTVGGP